MRGAFRTATIQRFELRQSAVSATFAELKPHVIDEAAPLPRAAVAYESAGIPSPGTLHSLKTAAGELHVLGFEFDAQVVSARQSSSDEC